MIDQVIRAQLRQLIDDIDTGRVEVHKPRGTRIAVGGVVLAASLSLGVAACGGSQGGGQHPAPPPTSTVSDPGGVAEYMAPDPGPVGPGEPVDPPPAQALYGIEAPQPVPPPQAEYAAPGPDDPDRPPIEPGPEPEYAAPGPAPGPPRFAPPPPPALPPPMPGPVPMYAVERPE